MKRRTLRWKYSEERVWINIVTCRLPASMEQVSQYFLYVIHRLIVIMEANCVFHNLRTDSVASTNAYSLSAKPMRTEVDLIKTIRNLTFILLFNYTSKLKIKFGNDKNKYI
jgi:hypothetical protein